MYKNGMTLIELLIALTIGILLISFISEIYLSSLHNYYLQQSIVYLKNNTEKALNFFSIDLKKTGHIGCARLTHDFKVDTSITLTITMENKITGTDNEIMMRFMEFPNAQFVAEDANRTYLYTNRNLFFTKGDVLLISDCRHAEIFQVRNIFNEHRQQKIIPSLPLKNIYTKNAEIGRLIIRKYFVSKTKRVNRNGKPIYSLYLQDDRQQKTEIVDGVNNMKIRYSIFNGGQLLDVPASSIPDWSKVVGIAITFEVTSFPFTKKSYLYVKI